MPTSNNFSLEKTQGQFGIVIGGDGISGLIALASGGTYPVTIDTPILFQSLAEAEAAGITRTGTDEFDLLHFHISEFFRFTPSQKLYFMLSDAAAFANLFTATLHADTLMNFSNGEIKQLGVVRITGLATAATGAGVATEVQDAVPPAQLFIDRQFDTFKRPLEVILEGHGWDGTVSAATDYHAATAVYPEVAIMVSQDPSIYTGHAAIANMSKYAAVGTLLGMNARTSVGTSVGYVRDGNLTKRTSTLWLAAYMSDGSNMTAYESVFDGLQSKGYTYAFKFPDYEGVYLNDAPTCVQPTQVGDVSRLRFVRARNKAARVLRQKLLPFVNSPLSLDADGTISAKDAALLETQGALALKEMKDNGELSGFNVYVDPTQVVTSSSDLVINFEVLPLGAAHKIKGKISMVQTL